MNARTAHLAFNGLVALWLGVAMPLLCVPGLTSDHDHGPHSIFAVPDAEAGHQDDNGHTDHVHAGSARRHHPSSGPIPPGRLTVTEPWPASYARVHTDEVRAAPPAAAAEAWPARDWPALLGRDPNRSSANLPGPWHPPRPV